MSENNKITKVRKGVSRKIQTRQFESLEVSVAYEDTISWDSIEERQDKLNKLSELALIDFNNTFNRVCEDIQVKPKSGSVTHKTEDGEVKTDTIPTENDNKDNKPMSNSDIDDFFDGV